MTFYDWAHRHLAGDDPKPEPAGPPPFKPGDRVVVSSEFEDSAFITGMHGVVVSADFTDDPEDEYGPWVIRVMLDNDKTPTKFATHELTRETTPPAPTEPPVITVTQPEDDEDFDPNDGPVPYVPTTPPTPLDSLGPWIQRAKELRHETVDVNTPVYDDVVQAAMSRDGFAAEVEAYLAEVTS